MICDLQKGSMTKRISAFLFDLVVWIMLTVGIATVMSAVLRYDNYFDMFTAGQEKYESQYGVALYPSEEEEAKMTEAEKQNLEAAREAFSKDKDIVYAYNMLINLALVIGSLSILLAYLILDFAVPMWLGHGRTLGKKIFGLAVMRIDGVKINGVSLFVRTVIGKFTLETMLPLMAIVLALFGGLGIFGLVIFGMIVILQPFFLLTSGTLAVIHDKLANTVVVDMSSQMIFSSELELIAYKEKLHAQKAAKQDY